MPRTLKPRVFQDKIRGEKMHTCYTCGRKYTRAEIKFDSGSVEPEEDEVLTGATSEATGVVELVTLVSGSWAGGDAAGFVELSSVTGIDEGDVFEDDEAVGGSVGGADILTIDGYGTEKSYGTMYPLSYLVKYKGKYYCKEHYRAHLDADLLKQGTIDVASLESERGKLP